MIKLSPLSFQKIITAVNFNAWEVGFYGITELDDLTRVTDVFMPVQQCNAGRNEFDEQSVSDYVARYLKSEHHMRQLTTVWIHTHPGKGVPSPSEDDREMFDRMMDHAGQVGIMLIATTESMKAWLRVKPIAGLKRSIETEEKVDIDWTMDIPHKFSYERWKKRHAKVVSELPAPIVVPAGSYQGSHAVGYGLQGISRTHTVQNAQCSICKDWKPILTICTRQCLTPYCTSTIEDCCYMCYSEKMGKRCGICIAYEDELLAKRADDVAAVIAADDCYAEAEIEQPSLPGLTPKCADPDCTMDCEACEEEPCEAREVDYNPATQCDGECADCLVGDCAGRDAIPKNMSCSPDGDCAKCEHVCQYEVDWEALKL